MSTNGSSARTRGPAPPRQMVTLRMPQDVHTQLRALAVFTDTTVNDLVLGLVTDYLDSEGRQRLKEVLHGLVPAEVEREAARLEADTRPTADRVPDGLRARRDGRGSARGTRTG